MIELELDVLKATRWRLHEALPKVSNQGTVGLNEALMDLEKVIISLEAVSESERAPASRGNADRAGS